MVSPKVVYCLVRDQLGQKALVLHVRLFYFVSVCVGIIS